MESARAIGILERRSTAIDGLRSSRPSRALTKWQRDTEVAVQRIFGADNRHSADFSEIRYCMSVFTTGTPDSDCHDAYLRGLDTAKSILSSMIEEIREYDLDSDADSPTKVLGTLEQGVPAIPHGRAVASRPALQQNDTGNRRRIRRPRPASRPAETELRRRASGRMDAELRRGIGKGRFSAEESKGLSWR